MYSENVILLGDIHENNTISTAILVKDKNGHIYYVLELANKKVLFVQSYTQFFKLLEAKGELAGAEIVQKHSNSGKTYLVVV